MTFQLCNSSTVWLAALLIFVFALPHPLAIAQQAPAPSGASLPEVLEAIQRARVTTRILYVTAHPDDEPGGLLAYLARGLGADVALLSLTRGEGGQNALGPEQAPQLGVIRSEELQRATQVYGTRLYFTRAADFGYTKSPDEALKVWGDAVLSDMVHVIRTFRPNVIINQWGGVTTGHGQHQATGILTPRAFEAAADANRFPEAGPAWKTETLLGLARGSRDQTQTASAGFEIPMNDFSPLWGKAWSEIGGEGYANHRSQGVGVARPSSRSRRTLRLTAVRGKAPSRALLAPPLALLAGRFPQHRAQLLPVLQAVNASTDAAQRAVLNRQWPTAARSLANAARQIAAARKKSESAAKKNDQLLFELGEVQRRLEDSLARIAGMVISPVSERAEVVPFATFMIQLSMGCRPEVKCAFSVTDRNASLRPAESPDDPLRYLINPPITARPYGVAAPSDGWMFAERNTVNPLEVSASVERYTMVQHVPIVVVKSTSTSMDIVPPALVPELTITAAPKQFVLRAGQTPRQLDLLARVSHYGTLAQDVKVGLDVPEGWTAPELQSFDFSARSAVLARLSAGLPESVKPGSYTLRPFAQRGRKFTTSIVPLVTIPSRLWLEPAEIRVHVMDINVPDGLRIGYVAADNDPIPRALAEIGVRVELLDEVTLAFGDLSKFDAICVGIRAYELRQDLIRSNARLLEYAEKGGTLVVQYQRDGVWNQLQPAPYPARMPQRDARITDENSPVRILEAAHPVLNFPNVIAASDFEGWVQERGLYFWGEWDAKYTPIFAMKDPTDEQETRGALLVAQHGKGTYIYTGIAFFRQLPEGVPGAYRLFVNLLSQSKKN